MPTDLGEPFEEIQMFLDVSSGRNFFLAFMISMRTTCRGPTLTLQQFGMTGKFGTFATVTKLISPRMSQQFWSKRVGVIMTQKSGQAQ